MIRRTLAEVQEMLGGHGLKREDQQILINGVTTDSRQVEKGSLFFPLVGDVFNGHEFVNKAIENGAAAVIWAEREGNPPQDIPVIFVEDTLVALQQLAKAYLKQLEVKVVGITGSNGKTSTKDMVASVLETTYKVHKTKGNFNNHIGLPLTVLSMEPDTEIAVLEMGMSGKGEIELLSKIGEPDVALITNIGEAHLQDLGSREAIAEAKLEITSGLKKDGLFIYHGDEPLLQERVPNLSLHAVTFGKGETNDYVATDFVQEVTGTAFKVKGEEYFIPVLGTHNVSNALAAFAVADYFQVKKEAIKKGFESMKLTGMRLELLTSDQGVSVINDAYNASPTSMKAAIALLEDLNGFHHKYAVLGDMLELGEDEKEFHREIGRLMNKKNITKLFTYGRLGEEIAKGAKEADEQFAQHFQDKKELIEKLQTVVAKQDVVLVKASRGMKLEEVVEALL
ncbi:UDP-N-acetylmuramoyl-tripeptide--D-alanyl-D-alanine ligase [Bacillus weihaiensis]|uniref:UDP-N-acetylmuramoyl-tripeptide--D-alanyl-D-alanine ligase n=1 Tax=Bacillus weihaiensis TaxID=1547283 RepID=A0A1L3MWB9_9BACI|nr:UDP-N-acetylmuramoyl-tripeptide--D-alanyl-D-alanine ligase [Bacillus weihaiensis]APH06580.1 UDP-N-acetylmuramoyl-tripeptide--D-alanyl-D-alanine ligase [Bacillus weihaiensis]